MAHSAGLNMFFSSRHGEGMGEAGPSTPRSIVSLCSTAQRVRRLRAACAWAVQTVLKSDKWPSQPLSNSASSSQAACRKHLSGLAQLHSWS